MSGTHQPEDYADATAYESGRAAGLAVVSQMHRATPLESTQRAWMLGFLQGALDAAGHSDSQTTRVACATPPHDAPQAVRIAGATPGAVRVSAIEAYGHSPEGQHEWLSVAFDMDEHRPQFAPGSSLALWPTNDAEEVRRVLRILNVNAQALVQTDYGTEPAWQVMLERVDLSDVTAGTLRCLAEYSRSDIEAKSLLELAERPPERPRTLLGVLRRYPSARPPFETLLKSLTPLKPSFVPIASSCLEQAKPLLVTIQSSSTEGGWGEVSRVIRSKLRVGEWLSASVDEQDFPPMLTTDDTEPVIIITDGPYVALARALAAERHERQTRGRTWLIVTGVGTTQFPYARTLSAWHRSGTLTRFDVAPGFETSDILQALEEREETLWRWLVDHSRLFVVARRPSIRAAITEWFVGLLARRYRLGRDAAVQRLDELSQQGQWVTLPQLAATA